MRYSDEGLVRAIAAIFRQGKAEGHRITFGNMRSYLSCNLPWDIPWDQVEWALAAIFPSEEPR